MKFVLDKVLPNHKITVIEPVAQSIWINYSSFENMGLFATLKKIQGPIYIAFKKLETNQVEFNRDFWGEIQTRTFNRIGQLIETIE